MLKLNSDDPLFDKDVVNLRTLNNALRKVEDSTLEKALQKFKNENSTELKFKNDTLFVKNAKLAEDGGIIYSGGTDLYDIFKNKDLKSINSFVYDENKIILDTDNDKFEITINEFKDLLIKENFDVQGILQYKGKDLNEIFVKKEDLPQKEVKEVFIENSVPKFYNFKESPNSIRQDFTSDVFYDSEIVFLNGLMQRKNLDYEIATNNDGQVVRFSNPPKTDDLINIYGVKFLEPEENVVEKELFKIVNNTEQLINISNDERTPGMLVYNLEEKIFFSLKNIVWQNDISDWKKLNIQESTNEELLFFDKEVLEGEINGINKIFLIQNIPHPNSEHIYLNGLLQDYDDYNIEGNKITFSQAPLLNSKLKCTYKLKNPTHDVKFSDREIPSGEINGINKTFFIENNPIENSEHVFINGLLQDSFQNNDYYIENNIIEFSVAPIENSKITCTYRY